MKILIITINKKIFKDLIMIKMMNSNIFVKISFN